jgi:antitoxin MazE
MQTAVLNPQSINLKLVPIGNSLGVRLSRPLLSKYGMESVVIAEQRPEGILLRGANSSKATLEQTFTEMAAAQEKWDDFDGVSNDGLDKLVW